MNKRVFIVDKFYSDHLVAAMFLANGWLVVNHLENASLVCFLGGEDVDPSLYGHRTNRKTYSSIERDEYEKKVYQNTLKLGKKMVGICRGGQFLNVMNGGTMYQHCDGHARGGTHVMFDLETGEEIHVTSTHHQMMNPSKEGKLVASANEATYVEEGDTDKKMSLSHDDIEVVYYQESNSLCFQPHPEYHAAVRSGCQEYFFRLLDRYFSFPLKPKPAEEDER